MYGTTPAGGGAGCDGSGCGVVFKIAPGKIETILYSFCRKATCADGADPLAALTFDKSGNLYGTTKEGGAGTHCPNSHGCGTVFMITPDGTETVLYSFCSRAACADGSYPAASVLVGGAGDLYGTTQDGGSQSCNVDGVGCGTVFKLAPAGKETVLHTFTGYPNDGAEPVATLHIEAGILYGTTLYGGGSPNCLNAGCGTVFKLDKTRAETVLYSFCHQQNCPDGKYPMGGVISDNAGHFFGTTLYGGGNAETCGGSGNCGTIFEVDADGTESVLHYFTGVDGLFPYAGLTVAPDGYMYGTTKQGGMPDCGTVFRIRKGEPLNEMYAFDHTGDRRYDGCEPETGIIFNKTGDIFGTTIATNSGGFGAVFKLSLPT